MALLPSLRSALRVAALAAACALLAACGFHLRDSLLLPAGMASVQVASSNPDGPLQQQLEQALQRAGATLAVAGTPAAAEAATLHIASEQLADTPISVGASLRSSRRLVRIISRVRSASSHARAANAANSTKLTNASVVRPPVVRTRS